jgi:hypothetical protein
MPQNGERDVRTGTGKANQNKVDANSFTQDLASSGNAGINAHINDEGGAHAASAITTTTSRGQYDGTDVQGNLDELSGLVPPRPATVGNFLSNVGSLSAINGIPDWGALKLADAGLLAKGLVSTPDANDPNTDDNIYPYYYYRPDAASPQPPFNPVGNDPASDPTFNVDPAGTGDPTYTGGGPGATNQGGFTRPPLANNPVIETMRVVPGGGGAFTPIVVSGVVYPADRGVLALFHWPADGGIIDFLAQPLLDRCLAAVLLGQGITADCDGDPGGIFNEGDPDVNSYPGRASGQYQLRELHTGLTEGSGAHQGLLAFPDGALSSSVPVLGQHTGCS